MPPYPEPLERIESEIDEQGYITAHDAYLYKRTLNVYAREAQKKNDPVLAAEVERLRAKVDSASMVPPLRVVGPVQTRSRTELFREAGVVWNQISPAERKALLDQMAIPYEEFRSDQAIQGAFWPEFFTDTQLSTIADYPRSQSRREYLKGQGGQQVRAYRRGY